MATDPLTVALVAVGSSLLTILLTPRLQQQFWKYQRRDELRLAAINGFNRLTAEFLTNHVAAVAAQVTHTPTNQWFTDFMAAGATIKALFSRDGFAAFKAVEVMIGPGTPGLGPQGNRTANDFVRARDAALRRLYGEIVPEPQERHGAPSAAGAAGAAGCRRRRSPRRRRAAARRPA